ncbi:leucyl aminopeptidase [Smaragdicoccus niigatensis]|uniref:leucyl aminopeptidase n=1 Tax=Smaragdicoccus niigatensis TaxID=359359 RepID=UPI000360FF70|nr:leucyl aminopeptidase [Smaragdicoccus niigatensis]
MTAIRPTINAGFPENHPDVLIIGIRSNDEGIEIATPVNGLPEDLAEQLAAVGAKGTAEEVTRIPGNGDYKSILAVGVGDTDEAVRKAAGVAARALKGGTACSALGELDVEAAVVGHYLGAYSFTEFKTGDSKEPPSIFMLTEEDSEDAVARGLIIAEAVAATRDFVNTPPSHLYPAEFASRAKVLAEEAGLEVEVLDDEQLIDRGYGGIIGVGKGSSRLPRLVRITYQYSDDAPLVALVGKGITFDTGGISIKPAASMDVMTCDMAGAAAVIASIVAAAKLGVKVNVTATVPMAENMPSGTAQRPGDVLTQYGGTTVEVLNTDAEGRLILADAIVRACEDDPQYLIDTATLTGAQQVALGNRTPGVMGTTDFRDRVARISQSVGEGGWAMPLPEELRSDLDSKVADLANVTNHRYGGMLSAGLFLKEFVPEGVEWAHVDIAGPAYNTGGPWGYTGKGGTGVPVRTILAVLEDIAGA